MLIGSFSCREGVSDFLYTPSFLLFSSASISSQPISHHSYTAIHLSIPSSIPLLLHLSMVKQVIDEAIILTSEYSRQIPQQNAGNSCRWRTGCRDGGAAFRNETREENLVGEEEWEGEWERRQGWGYGVGWWGRGCCSCDGRWWLNETELV